MNPRAIDDLSKVYKLPTSAHCCGHVIVRLLDPILLILPQPGILKIWVLIFQHFAPLPVQRVNSEPRAPLISLIRVGEIPAVDDGGDGSFQYPEHAHNRLFVGERHTHHDFPGENSMGLTVSSNVC
jgi:hypothetical protein